jgi:subtilisin family serine protease
MKRFLLVLLLLLGIPRGAHAQTALPPTMLAGEMLIKLAPTATLTRAAVAQGAHTEQLNTLLRHAGARLAQPLGHGSNTYRVLLNSETHVSMLAAQVAGMSQVVYAEPNHVRNADRTPNDTMLDQQWNLRTIRASDAWDITTGGDITIAVLDTGVSPTHPDLKDKLLPGYDFFNHDADPRDDEGHGTHTAGIAAAASDNGAGVAGICWTCKILPVKVLGRRGQGDDATIAEGIRWAVDHGARVISMSLGGPDDTRVLRDAVDYANDHDVLIVAASGNGQAYGNTPNYPAAYPSVMAVTATNSADAVTSFSTTGGFIDIAAPGVGVWSTIWDHEFGDTYGSASGTSTAAPHVAGAAALVLSERPDLHAGQVAEILEASADDVDAPGKDSETGFGRLNVLRAVEQARDPNVLNRSRIQGTVNGAPADQVTLTLNTGQQTTPDAQGNYSFENLPTGSYTVTIRWPNGQTEQQQTWLSGTQVSVATLSFTQGGAASPAVVQPFQPVPPPANAALTYFPQTQHTMGEPFRSFWQRNGGLPIFGYPISEAFTERGEDGRDYTVQYFERHRLEAHPENAPPYNMLLARIGDSILQQNGRNWFTFETSSPQPGCRYFPQTRHNVCGPFLSYWQSQGLQIDGNPAVSPAESLALFGQPLSDPQMETLSDGQQHLVQWFERARFELHDNGVLLGLLGEELAAGRK